MRPDVGLLVFTRNNGAEALRSIDRFASVVRETVLVDSSNPPFRVPAGAVAAKAPVKLIRAVPTGYPELLLPFAVHHLTAEWVLRVDPDEEPTDGLLDRLRHLAGDGYAVPRQEQAVGGFTLHPRLFRRTSFAIPNPAYAFLPIRGTVRRLAPGEGLIHHHSSTADLADDYGERWADVECIERPYDRKYLASRLGPLRFLFPELRARDPGTGSEPLNGPATLVARSIDAMGNLLTVRSLRLTAFRWRYDAARARFLQNLSPEELRHRTAVTREARRAGGLIRFLGFDDPDYVTRLTDSFAWDDDRANVLHRLLNYRLTFGRPMPRWG
jgi:hypothetical protein